VPLEKVVFWQSSLCKSSFGSADASTPAKCAKCANEVGAKSGEKRRKKKKKDSQLSRRIGKTILEGNQLNLKHATM